MMPKIPRRIRHVSAVVCAVALLPSIAEAQAGPAPGDLRIGVAGSFLPNLGFELGMERVIRRSSTSILSAEVRIMNQFLDDKAIVDDGDPEAGPWYQVRAGLARASSPDEDRRVTTAFGAVWLRAEGDPNWIQEPGDYAGLYAAVGFVADLTPTISMGPEATLMGVTHTDRFALVRPIPQVNWRGSVRLGRAESGDPNGAVTPTPPDDSPAPRDVYIGGSGGFSPGLGWGLHFGQVLHRGVRATWSVEAMVALQNGGDRLYFNEPGEWAQVRIGARATFPPSSSRRWTVRAGAAWVTTTAANDFLRETDHVGVYGGLGYEYVIGRIITGPEVALLLVTEEDRADPRAVPQLTWHVSLGFF